MSKITIWDYELDKLPPEEQKHYIYLFTGISPKGVSKAYRHKDNYKKLIEKAEAILNNKQKEKKSESKRQTDRGFYNSGTQSCRGRPQNSRETNKED